MEKTFTFLEGFGVSGAGDGFAGAPGELPGALIMSACAIVRLGGYDVVNGVLPGGSALQICGEVGPVPSGWGFVLRGTRIGSMIDTANLGPGFDFTNIGKPMGNQAMVLHVVADSNDPNSTGRAYINGSLVSEGNIAPVFPGNRPTIGIPSVVDATLLPLGAVNAGAAGAQYNGVAGMTYGRFAMTTAEVALHYRQILDAQDVVQGTDAAGSPFGFTSLYSVRRSLSRLSATTAVFPDLIGGVDLTREQIGGQQPSLVVRARRVQMF